MTDQHRDGERVGGVLLHPTSLPGPFGIGDLGPSASRWVGWLARSGCHLWQVLPLGPTGYGDSPYQSFSAFAGNPLLISPEGLAADGLLDPSDLDAYPGFAGGRVDYGQVIPAKTSLLSLAAGRFEDRAGSTLKAGLERFEREEADWLADYALFMALKAEHDGRPWTTWDEPLARRRPAALAQAADHLAERLRIHKVIQFLFFRQWASLKEEAKEAGVSIVGDLPIFVAHDSADVWSLPSQFELDQAGEPAVVAGVPPDYFSATGQRWGNPPYRWDRMAEDGYRWWIGRIRSTLKLVDLIRLDHFRGFQAHWEIPAEETTAVNGRWAAGPGRPFFEAAGAALGRLPFIAEDLGIITPEVEELRDGLGLPGMKVLQFAFDGDPNQAYLPHNFPVNCVVYTGTHDNDTTLGWFRTLPESTRAFCRSYLDLREDSSAAWRMIRAAWASVARMAVAPMQDLLSLDSESRMNTPGGMQGNWSWRLSESQLSDQLADDLREVNFVYGRLPQGE